MVIRPWIWPFSALPVKTLDIKFLSDWENVWDKNGRRSWAFRSYSSFSVRAHPSLKVQVNACRQVVVKIKFGLAATQVLQLIDITPSHLSIDSLYYYISIWDHRWQIFVILQPLCVESARFCWTHKLGKIFSIDVGGGLGVDSWRTRLQSDCSVNYGIQWICE